MRSSIAWAEGHYQVKAGEHKHAASGISGVRLCVASDDEYGDAPEGSKFLIVAFDVGPDAVVKQKFDLCLNGSGSCPNLNSRTAQDAFGQRHVHLTLYAIASGIPFDD